MDDWNNIEDWLKQQKETKDGIEQLAELLAKLYNYLVERGLPQEVAASLTAVFLSGQFSIMRK